MVLSVKPISNQNKKEVNKESFVNKILFLCLLLPLFLQLVSCENVQTLGQLKKDSNILLKQNCVNVTYVNITSISVNGIQNVEMIRSPISMSLISNGYQTYNFTNNSLLGQYIITGICDENSVVKSWSYNYEVTPSGTILSTVQISVYLFFLLVCLVLTFFSIRLMKNYKMSNDKTKGSELYELKKRNEFLFYVEVLKKQLWILGAFGIYFSLFIFSALLEQLVYNLGLSDLDNILQYVNLGFAWGLIPFTIFWFVWLIFVFYISTTEIMRYQFGALGGKHERS